MCHPTTAIVYVKLFYGHSSVEQVEKANHEQLARWYRFLPSGDTKEQQKVLDKVSEKFKKLGGMTPALEKKIGF